MKKLFLIFFLPLALLGEVDFSDFDRFHGTMTRHQVEERLNCFLEKGAGVGESYRLTDSELTLLDGEKEAFALKLCKAQKPALYKRKRSSLKGLKVAIDPGHFGGRYARLEARFIDLPPNLERKGGIQFDEGTLCFLTAVHIKELLEKEGAIVFLTRSGIGKGAHPLDFFDWLKQHPEHWNSSLKSTFCRHYNILDLRARADKINSFDPDLTLILHFNSHENTSDDRPSNYGVTAENFNLVFTPGAFCSGELNTDEKRYDFIRLLVTDHLCDSLELSRSVLKAFGKHLDVPSVSPSTGARYLSSVCLKLDEGVYARNLALTRRIRSPLCYGETLVQNNIDESQNLSRNDCTIGGIPCSSRLKQVARAYFEGIKSYLTSSSHECKI